MEFLRHRDDYAEPMSLDEAIKELKLDPRINSIKKKIFGGLVITTNEIITYPSKYSGVFILTVSKTPKRRKINIRIRKLYDEGHIAQHVWTNDNDECTEEICWGNIKEQIEIIKYHKDYYWLVKLAIDLIENKQKTL
jgi:hypothetical protein